MEENDIQPPEFDGPGKYPSEVSVPMDKMDWSGKCTELTTDAEIPEGAGIEITVHQDMDGDGESENSQTVELRDGKFSYPLVRFDHGGEQVWAEITFKSDGENGASIGSFQLEGQSR